MHRVPFLEPNEWRPFIIWITFISIMLPNFQPFNQAMAQGFSIGTGPVIVGP